MTAPILDATTRQFLDDPYAVYAQLRQSAPVCRVGPPYDTYWVLSHKLVAEVNARKDEFLKPGQDRASNPKNPFAVVNCLKDGLFFMDPPRHGEVRAMMNGIFEGAIADAEKYAEAAAKDLLDTALAQGQMEAIKDFAGPLASRVFFKVMGVPELGQRAVDQWVRAALDAHRRTMPDLQRALGGSAQLAMQAYFLGLVNAPADPNTIPNSILAGMRQRTGCPAAKDVLQYDESMNTALHMALGGYLSTQFLIGSGVYNLLRHPQQWQLLRADRSLMPQAIDEMLRYDAPFQLADRWVRKGTQLGDKTFDQDTVLAVVYGSANRDRSVFSDDADRFDIERKLRKDVGDWTPNLGFGDGIHRCIGEGLARTITAVALNALLDRCPTARIGEVGSWAADPYFRSLTRLQLLLR